MNFDKLPWRETLLIFLLIALSMSLSNLRMKNQYVQDIATHPWMRFGILFMTAFLLFSLDIDGKYSMMTRVVVSAVVALIIQMFVSANMTLMPLTPLQPPKA